jgi:hypothetical protein
MYRLLQCIDMYRVVPHVIWPVTRLLGRVARCVHFQIWVVFGGVLHWKILVHLINFADIMYTYFIGIWYNFWLFDVFFPFWYVVQRKIWQPCLSDSVQIF